MIQTGILKPGDRVELIHGWIVPKWPLHPTHASVVRRLDRLLQKIVKDAAVIGVRQPITTADSEPEPDVTVSRSPENLYFTTHPVAEDIYFVIEVSDTTLAYDQGEKQTLYARARIAMYWIVNLEDRRVEVYTEPSGVKNLKYRQQSNYGPRDKVPVVVDGKQLGRIPVKEVLP